MVKTAATTMMNFFASLPEVHRFASEIGSDRGTEYPVSVAELMGNTMDK